MVIGHLAGAFTIARTEVRRSVRTVTSRLSQILGLGFGLFVFSAGSLAVSVRRRHHHPAGGDGEPTARRR